MKHTKNMIIRETPESIELALFIENDGELYRRQISPAIKNLKKKYNAGKYDKQKAIDLYYYIATAGALEYCRQFASVEDAPHIFDVTARYTAAADLESYYFDEVTYTEN